MNRHDGRSVSSIVVSDLAYAPPGADQLFFDVGFVISPGEHAAIVGANGVGKSTIVEALVKRDPRLWLSRSWTTRDRRPGESSDAYRFVTREEFQRRIDEGGFLEWTEFIGNLYGTPSPEPPSGSDIVLEIEVDGAQQVKRQHPQALLIFVLPPTREEQRSRLVGRGDADTKVHDDLAAFVAHWLHLAPDGGPEAGLKSPPKGHA